MEIAFFIGLGLVLVFILGALLFVLLSSARKKRVMADKNIEKKDLKSLRAIIENKQTSSKELTEALDEVLKYYGVINKNFDVYMEIIFSICLHPNTNKNIILNFDKELRRLNPVFKTEINDALTKGLNSRGI